MNVPGGTRGVSHCGSISPRNVVSFSVWNMSMMYFCSSLRTESKYNEVNGWRGSSVGVGELGVGDSPTPSNSHHYQNGSEPFW